jgi:hypothetical protein
MTYTQTIDMLPLPIAIKDTWMSLQISSLIVVGALLGDILLTDQ